MKANLKLWAMLLISHLALAIIPSLITENKLTAFIPYHSIFMPLDIFKSLVLPVYGQAGEEMFMAPITVLGWCLVVALWLIIHFGFAVLLSHLTNKGKATRTARLL
ncbi:hypothetical protein ORJ00_15945 [Rheinheimera baltica]|uniref:hypothetical protein n=1 Tax=Rheinheimera baltica TaxID=67576 RepID=UPI00273E0410|nr:hypothetical protein [Rheinheimera baltica]MDP5144240.1 hypothetical protein [Rheinheimera baltica]